MANLDDLRNKAQAAAEENRKAYDALHGQFGTQNVAREYKIAKRDNNKEDIARLKPLFEKLNAAYTKTQNEKNRIDAELKAAEKAETTGKTEAAKAKGLAGTYKNALEDLSTATDNLDAGGYKAEENYNAAYLKAETAFNNIKAKGKTPPAELPAPKITITRPTPEASKGDGTTVGKDGKSVVEVLTPFLDTIADPKNAAQLADVQSKLQKNFSNVYKGGLGGLKDWAATASALNDIFNARSGLPKTLKNVDFITFLADPNSYGLISSTAGGGAGAKTTSPYQSPETDAAATIQSTIKSELGRDATTAEISSLTKALNAYEKQHPYLLTQGSRSGGGVNQAEFIRELITGQKTIKGLFNTKTDAQTIKDINQIIKGVTTEFSGKKGEANKLASQDLTGTLQANGLDKLVTQSQIDTWTNRIRNGEKVDTIKNEIRAMAKTGMPDSVKKLLDAGNDLSTIYSPYKQAMASVLELNPNSIDMNDPTLRSAIGPNGEMPLYDFQNALRKDNRWQYTNNAKTAVADSVTQVLKDFGFMG